MEKITQNKKDFAIGSQWNNERTGNYDKQSEIANKWQKSSPIEYSNGNVSHNTVFDIEKQSIALMDYQYGNEKYISLYTLISSPLLMYRLICVFGYTPIIAESPYKVVWEYPIEHKETGIQISFSEWKGGIYFGMKETDYKKLPQSYKDDFIALFNHLISNECAHPYDGLVAGSVA